MKTNISVIRFSKLCTALKQSLKSRVVSRVVWQLILPEFSLAELVLAKQPIADRTTGNQQIWTFKLSGSQGFLWPKESLYGCPPGRPLVWSSGSLVLLLRRLQELPAAILDATVQRFQMLMKNKYAIDIVAMINIAEPWWTLQSYDKHCRAMINTAELW